MVRVAIASMLAIGTASSVSAQDAAVSDFRAETCARAFQGVRDDQSTVERWRLIENLSGCGAQGGAALARELGRLRGMNDLDTMNRLFQRIVRIEDASVFEAALELAADKSATVEARVVAFRIFVEYEDPSRVTTFEAFQLPWQEGRHICGLAIFGVVDHGGHSRGAPLPDAWEERVRDLLTRIWADTTDSDPVRAGVRKVLFAMGGAAGISDLRPPCSAS